MRGAPAGTTARGLEPGRDTRLAANGDSLAVTADAEIALTAGGWALIGGGRQVPVAVLPGGRTVVHWPAGVPDAVGLPMLPVPRVVGPAGPRGGFALSRTEVTVAAYAAFLADPAIHRQAKESWARHLAGEAVGKPLALIPRKQWDAGDAGGVLWKLLPDPTSPDIASIKPLGELDPQAPVTGIDRSDAEAFCAWAAKQSGRRLRLPRLDEIAFAAGAGDERRIWVWGELFDSAFTVAAPAASNYRPAGSVGEDTGPFGHVDLAGNVREWLADRSGARQCLVYGGSWADDRPDQFRTTASESIDPVFVSPVFGFRLLEELPASP